ncbi:hypothetical protein GCM10028864_19400 [Microlunatus parietis]
MAGCAVLVVGGGAGVLATVAALREARAVVTVAAEDVVASLEDLADRGLIRWHRGPVTEDLIRAAALVVAGSGDADHDQDLAERCERAGRPVRRLEVDQGAPGQAGGEVILVGGGPGDPGLLTVAGLAALRRADVIITDRLAPLASIAEARPGTEVIDVGKVPGGRSTRQESINALLIEHARAGRVAVRLKGGDNFVFGRGGEEWEACSEAGIPVTIVPGVSSATAVPGLAGIPVTHRELVQGFTVVTGHVPPDHPGSTLDWAGLARSGTTLVIMMGVATLPAIAAELIKHGMPADLPAATIADGGLPSMAVVRGPLERIGELTERAGIRPPAITVIGAVAGLSFG